MQHLDEGTIHAWLDGELPSAEREALEAHVASCAQCAAVVAEARGFVAASSRILTALDTVPGGVLPAASTGSGAARPAMRRRFVASRAWMAAAAVLVLSTVTVIATRPHGESAQLQVAAAARDQKDLPAAKPSVAPPAADSHVVEAPAPAAPVATAPSPTAARAAGKELSKTTPAAMQSRAAVPAEEPKPVDQTERLKSRLEAERQSTRVRQNESAPPAMATSNDMADKREDGASAYDSTSERRLAADARELTITGRVTSEAGEPLASASVAVEGTNVATLTHADGSYSLAVPAARANGQKTTSLVARLIGYKAVAVPIAPASAPITHDFVLSSNPLALGEIVVTGEGVTSAHEKLGAVIGTNESPVVMSRSTSTEAGDTVVTTVYAVRDGRVTLIERSASRDEARSQKRSPGFSDQVMAKAQASTPTNSITWSDSAGHTRTLRGAVSRADLERIRMALFGATP
jgi:CarboxypepD_reg-like domain/Putative zinc-finger